MNISQDDLYESLLQETSKKRGCKRKTKITVAIKKTGKTTRSKPIKKPNKGKETIQLDESDLEDDIPLAFRLPKKPKGEPSEIIFPHITGLNWDIFEAQLKKKETDEITKKLNACLARMHSYEVYNTHFSSLHFVRLAIVDSLLNRKWDNLLKLVVMLGRNYSDPVFTMLIRHLCQILKCYHPAIRGTHYEDQIDLIVEKYKNKRDKRTNINSSM